MPTGAQRCLAPAAALAVLVAATLAAPPAARADAVSEAAAHLEAGRYKQGYDVLNAAHGKTRGEPRQYARVLLALATFYERHAGDFDEAARYLGEVLQLGLPAADPTVKAARRARDLTMQSIS